MRTARRLLRKKVRVNTRLLPIPVFREFLAEPRRRAKLQHGVEFIRAGEAHRDRGESRRAAQRVVRIDTLRVVVAKDVALHRRHVLRRERRPLARDDVPPAVEHGGAGFPRAADRLADHEAAAGFHHAAQVREEPPLVRQRQVMQGQANIHKIRRLPQRRHEGKEIPLRELRRAPQPPDILSRQGKRHRGNIDATVRRHRMPREHLGHVARIARPQVEHGNRPSAEAAEHAVELRIRLAVKEVIPLDHASVDRPLVEKTAHILDILPRPRRRLTAHRRMATTARAGCLQRASSEDSIVTRP